VWKSARLLPLAAIVSTISAGRLAAHDMDFALSKDWQLPSYAEREFEAWTTWAPRQNDFEQQLKFEYGVTDDFAIEPGVEFTKPNSESFRLENVELEAYFHFRRFDFDRFLPAVEAEVERRVQQADEEDGEPRGAFRLRGIMSYYTRDEEDFTLNLIVTRTVGGERPWLGEVTMGYLRPLDFIPGFTPWREHPLAVGLELSQSLSDVHATSFGPVLTWRATESLHVVLNGTVALNHRDHQEDELRLVLEWEF